MAHPIRSRWDNQFVDRPESSKLHSKIRELILKNPIMKSLKCYQEVPVVDLCPDYYSNAHRFDWYCEELNLVIEVHGQQHYTLTNRGNIGRGQAEREFAKSRMRDSEKKQAALEAGYNYLEISYKDVKKLTHEGLQNLLFESSL